MNIALVTISCWYQRIARHTGGKIVSDMSDLEGNEVFEADCLGNAEEVSQERICDDELILIKGGKAHTSASIILRGANDRYKHQSREARQREMKLKELS